MAKKTDVLNGWVTTLAGLGVDVPAQLLEDYLKGQGISPGQVTDELLLEHAESIRLYATTPVLAGESSTNTGVDWIEIIEAQSSEARYLGRELRPWIKQKAKEDADAIADVLTSYGPLVMGRVQQRIADDPFGAQIANFRRQIQGQLAGVVTDVEALPPSSEG